MEVEVWASGRRGAPTFLPREKRMDRDRERVRARGDSVNKDRGHCDRVFGLLLTRGNLNAFLSF